MHEENIQATAAKRLLVPDSTNGASPPRKQLRMSDEPTKSNAQVEKLIVDFVVQDMQPLSIVEGAGFRNLLHGLNPKVKVMCTETLKSRLHVKLTDMKSKLKEDLRSCAYVSTTADIWTQQARSYIGVTCHWLGSDDFSHRSVALAFRRFLGTHSYDKIASVLMDIHSEFDLDSSKIVNVVTDNGSNFIKAFKEYAEPGIFDADSDTEEVHQVAIGDIFSECQSDDSDCSVVYLPSHVSCFSHTLNLLATTDASKAIEHDAVYKRLYRSVAGKCTSLSNAAHQSSKAAETLFEVLGKTIPKPNSTRWNSEFDSYCVIYELREKINIAMERVHLPKFSNQELSFLAEWIEVMRPISQALDKLQGENTVDAYFGSVLPTLCVIQKKLASFTPTHTTSLVTALQRGMKGRFDDILNFDEMATSRKQKALVLAAVSHPFFKLRWLPSSYRKQAEQVFLCEVVHLAETGTRPNTSEASSSSTDFYGFHDSESDNDTESAYKVEGLQFLSDPSHDVDQLKRLVIIVVLMS